MLASEQASKQASMDLWVVASWWSGKFAKSVCNLSPRACLACAVAWEVIDNSHLGTALWGAIGMQHCAGESATNTLLDVVAVLCGYYSVF